jgi:hypothetical protein
MKYNYDEDFNVTSVKKGGGSRKSGGERKKGDKKGNAPTCYSSKHVRKQLAQQETKLNKK